MPNPEFLNFERVVVVATGEVGVIHHSAQFPGEPWKFYVDFPEGKRAPFEVDELARAEDK